MSFLVDRIQSVFRLAAGTAVTLVTPRDEILVRVVFNADPGAVAQVGWMFVARGAGFTAGMAGADFDSNQLLASYFFDSHQTITGNQGTVSENFVHDVGITLAQNEILTVNHGGLSNALVMLFFAASWSRERA